MKTAIVYYSKHHGNTKKLVDAIASQYEITLILWSVTDLLTEMVGGFVIAMKMIN